MKIAVVGSRNYPDLAFVRKQVARLKQTYGRAWIVSGGARGVDAVAEQAARTLCLPVLIFTADWSQGKGAGFTRNAEIIEHADIVVAFWDGHSRGTLDTISKARKAGKHTSVFGPDGRLIDESAGES